jgi:hypothetical protein
MILQAGLLVISSFFSSQNTIWAAGGLEVG